MNENRNAASLVDIENNNYEQKPHSIKVNTTADPLLQLVSLATRRNLRRSPKRSRIYDVLVIPPSFSKPLGAKAIN